MHRLALLLLVLAQLSCAARSAHPPPSRTCVVLSVGGSAGLAHLGALEALRAQGLIPDCVVGNSMGALVGSLYATSPRSDLRARYRQLLRLYEEDASREALGRGAAGAVLGLGVGALLDGPLELMALIGGVLGASTTPEMSVARLQRSLDTLFQQGLIQQTPVPFVTFYQQPQGQGVVLVRAQHGSLARAVAASASNPLLFEDVEVGPGRLLDAGADRVSAVPVQDACEAFPHSRLIVINVTGQPAFYARELPCLVHEVRVDVSAGHEAFSGRGESFEALYRAGWDAVRSRSDWR